MVIAIFFLKERVVCIFASLEQLQWLRFCDDIVMYLMYGTSLCRFLVEIQKKTIHAYLLSYAPTIPALGLEYEHCNISKLWVH